MHFHMSLKKKGVKSEIGNCRESRKMIIGKTKNEEKNKEAMKNKFKLNGRNIFIVHDLS